VSRRALVLAVVVALVEAAVAAYVVLTSDIEHHRYATTALALTAGLSFVAAGLVALRRRPENRTGFYLAAVGYLWFLGAAGDIDNSALNTAGRVVSNLAFVPFAALVLAFPTGRLARIPDRLLVRITALFVVVGPASLLLFDEQPPSCNNDCGRSDIVVYHSPTIERVVDDVWAAITVAIIVAVVGVLVVRWRRASESLRRLLLPVYLAAAGALVAQPNAVTVGASGAIFGLLGAGVILEWRATGSLAGNYLTLIIINLGISFAVPGISIGGHIGGLIGGFLVTLGFTHLHGGRTTFGGITGAHAATLIAVGVGAVLIAYWKVRGLA